MCERRYQSGERVKKKRGEDRDREGAISKGKIFKVGDYGQPKGKSRYEGTKAVCGDRDDNGLK